MACLLVPSPLVAIQGEQHLLGPRVEAFQRAFNSGDTVIVRRFVQENYDPRSTRQEGAADYWGALFLEVGPLALLGLGEQTVGTEVRPVAWFRGTRTRAWIGIEFDLADDASGRIVNHAVWRGVRPHVAVPASPVPLEQLADSLGTVLAESARHDHFSGAVVVSRGNETLLAEAYGFADRTNRIPVTLDTPFPIGSVTKMFTGVAMMKLIDLGRVSLDDPVGKYVPEYPAHISAQVTIRHLLTHTSGIELDDDAEYRAAVLQARSMSDLLEAQVSHIERLNRGNYRSFEPLDAFDYTNEGIDLLGIVIERVAEEPWSQFIRRSVLEPAGMRISGTDFLDPVKGLAVGYTSRDQDGEGRQVGGSRRAAKREEGGGWIRPAGTGYASALDLQRFIAALSEHRLLTVESTRQMTSPQVEIPVPPGLGLKRWYGYTVDVTETDRGVRYIGHSGSAPGVNAIVNYYPDLDLTVIILSNFDRAALHVSLFIQDLLGA